MDWIETVGDTIEDAKDTALDRLGVAIDDAEFEVVEDAETGWFGRVKSKARVRARVRPSKPRDKGDANGSRRGRGGNRRRRGGGDNRRQKSGGGQSEGNKQSSGNKQGSAKSGRSGGSNKSRSGRDESKGSGGGARRSERVGAAGGKRDTKNGRRDRASTKRGEDTVREDLSVDEQAEVAKSFMVDLLDAFEIEGSVEIAEVDEETREVAADGGEGIGLLIGPKGRTIDAIQELVRTTVQRRSAPGSGRVKVDIAGYRQRRREALARFAASVAEEVLDAGEERALEPMRAADRKVVHDAVADIEGIETRSDGEDPRRRVVICPAD